MKVARHFSAGYAFKSELVPEGRLKITSGKRVQASLRDASSFLRKPGTEVPGYLQSFLRNGPILTFAEVSERVESASESARPRPPIRGFSVKTWPHTGSSRARLVRMATATTAALATTIMSAAVTAARVTDTAMRCTARGTRTRVTDAGLRAASTVIDVTPGTPVGTGET